MLLGVVVHDRAQHHQLDAAALEQRHLVLLAELGEGVDLLGHLDDALDGELRQVDHADQARLRAELVEAEVLLLPDGLGQGAAGDEELLQPEAGHYQHVDCRQ